MVSVCLCDGKQNALKSGASPAIVRRKVGATEERTSIRGKKCGEWPSTLPADSLNGRLIAAVNIRALVAVYFNGNVIFINELRDLGILVRFAIHYMAPMAPDRPNIEQHRLVLALGLLEGIGAPLMPFDRLMHGRTQIRGRRIRERVGLHRIHVRSVTQRSLRWLAFHLYRHCACTL